MRQYRIRSDGVLHPVGPDGVHPVDPECSEYGDGVVGPEWDCLVVGPDDVHRQVGRIREQVYCPVDASRGQRIREYPRRDPKDSVLDLLWLMA